MTFNTKLCSTFLLQWFTPTHLLPPAPSSMSSALSFHTAHTALLSSSSAFPLLFHVSFPPSYCEILTQDIQPLLFPLSVCETDACGELQVLSPLESSLQSALNQVSELRGNFRNGVTQAEPWDLYSQIQGTILHCTEPDSNHWFCSPTSLQLLP